MLTAEQICSLTKHKQYKKTKGIRYNWKNSNGIVSLPEFSMFDISIGGKPWMQAAIFWKILVFLFKRCIIAREVGHYRNAVIERIIDSSIGEDDDICDLMTPGMKWVAADSRKMAQIKSITSRFIKDPKNQQIFFEAARLGSNPLQRKDFIDNIVDKLNRVFDNKIADLQRKVYIENGLAYMAFIADRQGYIGKHMAKNFSTGNLATVAQDVLETEEIKHD
jgi:hypothetical protein